MIAVLVATAAACLVAASDDGLTSVTNPSTTSAAPLNTTTPAPPPFQGKYITNPTGAFAQVVLIAVVAGAVVGVAFHFAVASRFAVGDSVSGPAVFTTSGASVNDEPQEAVRWGPMAHANSSQT